MKPDVSIIMPSLNVVNYIEECLQSVMNQTLSNIEIICVDAGSTDGTLEIIENYAIQDSRIRIIHSDRKSYGYQMNLGIRDARGEYIGIVETDDYVEAKMFEQLYAIVQNSRIDFVKSGYISFFEHNGERFFLKNQNVATKKVNGALLDLSKNTELRLADTNHIWSAIYRRQFLVDNDLWFNETPGASFQDTSFSILVGLVAKQCVYLDDCFYYYRTDRAESSVKSNEKYNCIVDEFEYIDSYLKKHGLDTDENRRMVAELKLMAYRWNLMRLADESRSTFQSDIAVEMKAFEPEGEYYSYLSEEEKETVELLVNPFAVKRLEQKQDENRRKILDILERGKNKEEYVFVGAGRYFEKFLSIQKVMQCPMIKVVCDNKKELQGKVIGNCKVISVEEAAGKYKNMKWLVANKFHAQEIRQQLLELEISDRDIVVIDYLPDISELGVGEID